ncbi:MAG: sulfite dehydrogenase [Thiotrichales bacterium]|nr:sulfite dehydrogenase [Thiotrichales bacterium]
MPYAAMSRKKPTIDASDRVAGNGLLHRRVFLKQGLGFGLVAGFAALAARDASAVEETGPPIDPARPPWMAKPGEEFSLYGSPSKHEDQVVRFASPNRVMRMNGAAWTPLHKLEGTITPNGLHYERHHNGMPQIDPEHHRLLIHGLVKTDLIYTVDDLLRYPVVSKICFLECGGNSNSGWNSQPALAEVGYFHGLASNSEWTGIPLATLLDETGIKPGAEWLIAEGADAFAMNISVPLDKALKDGMLALYQNGERLRPENGYPLRLLLPGWEGVMNVKWLRRIKLSSEPIMARNETSKYTELQPSGKARLFTHTMEAKSLILSPSGGMVLKSGPGLYQITGLAWSGYGKIKKVEVSADGGATWAGAELQEPVLDRAFTRFRIPWQWDGTAAVLKSRAIDETGYVQPERKELVKNRGRHGFYHYNAIVIWNVDKNGTVTHVYEKDEPDSKDGEISIDAGWD